MSFTRRTFVRGALLLTAGAAVGSGLAACTDSGKQTAQVPPQGFDGQPRPLPIPPALRGTDEDGRKVFELTARSGHTEILPGRTTRTWGFNGDFLGPTLVMSRGDEVEMRVRNTLPEMTTVHWHGMHLPAYSDGGPHSPIDPDTTWSPRWRVDQPAACVWYHPHPHLATATHAYRGLAGMILIEDKDSAQLDLPRDYGVDDIPVVIMDAKFTEDGQLDHRVDDTLGLLGTTPVVNGITNPVFEATTTRVRLRLLNGASMRFYTLALYLEEASGGEAKPTKEPTPFYVIATDQGLLDAPVEADELLLGPGERAEIIVDLPAGGDTLLRSVPRKDNFGIPQDEYSADFGFKDEFQLLRLRPSADVASATSAATSAAATAPLPERLAQGASASESADPADAVSSRDFVLNTFTINGQFMDMARVDFAIDHAGTEIWTVLNENADWPHNFHIHNARFKVIDYDAGELGKKSGAADGERLAPGAVATMGWKDVINLPPKASASLLVEFGHFPDKTIPYMFHCHMLLHEDEGMMGQFVILDKGEQPDVRVKPAALVFEKHAHSSGIAHPSIDASRSPYATPTAQSQ